MSTVNAFVVFHEGREEHDGEKIGYGVGNGRKKGGVARI
jgi:hypothetical protein